MIDFNKFTAKFNISGLWIDMLAQTAIVDEIFINDEGNLVIRVTAYRNLGKSQPPDEYVFTQEDAEKYKLSKWRCLGKFEGRYIYTQTSAYRPIEPGLIVTVYKPVMQNQIIIGACPVKIDLRQHCTELELQQLLEQSKSQAEYEAWWKEQLREYERVSA